MPAAPYFYSRASREARRLMREKVSLGISTHAPLARRDPPVFSTLALLIYYFYSRASREARLLLATLRFLLL